MLFVFFSPNFNFEFLSTRAKILARKIVSDMTYFSVKWDIKL